MSNSETETETEDLCHDTPPKEEKEQRKKSVVTLCGPSAGEETHKGESSEGEAEVDLCHNEWLSHDTPLDEEQEERKEEAIGSIEKSLEVLVKLGFPQEDIANFVDAYLCDLSNERDKSEEDYQHNTKRPKRRKSEEDYRHNTKRPKRRKVR